MALEAHPFTSFNKPGANGTQTLIGNWVEERVLEQSTSYSRYKVRFESINCSELMLQAILTSRHD